MLHSFSLSFLLLPLLRLVISERFGSSFFERVMKLEQREVIQEFLFII